jgi:hypothetical protein
LRHGDDFVSVESGEDCCDSWFGNRVSRLRQRVRLSATEWAVGWILFLSRRYDEALPELRSVAAVRPNGASAVWHLGYVLIAKKSTGGSDPLFGENSFYL